MYANECRFAWLKFNKNKGKPFFLVLIVLVVSFIVDFKAHRKTTFLAFENLIFYSIFNLSHFRNFASLVEFFILFLFLFLSQSNTDQLLPLPVLVVVETRNDEEKINKNNNYDNNSNEMKKKQYIF